MCLVRFPEFEHLIPVLIDLTESTTAGEATDIAAEEWRISPEVLELQYADRIIAPHKTLQSQGIAADSELYIIRMLVFPVSKFEDDFLRSKLPSGVELALETKSFVFSNGEVRFDSSWVSDSVNMLYFCSPDPSITGCEARFLSGTAIKKLNIDGFSFFKTISDAFLAGCEHITRLDLSCMTKVTEIGYDFLWECTSLVDINLSGLTNVTKIDNNFLGVCESLKSVDLSGFKNVVEIGDLFMFSCTSLTSVDLSGFKNLRYIGNLLLSDCTSLEEVDLSASQDVSRIGSSFLQGCSALRRVDLTSFKSLSSVGEDFLRGCSSMTTADLSSLKLEHIPNRFLYCCQSLVTLNLRWHEISTVGDSFLHGCKSIAEVPIAQSKLVAAGHDFLNGCESLESIDWTAFQNIEAVGTNFLRSTRVQRDLFLNNAGFAGADLYRGRQLQSIARMPLPV